MAVATAPSTKTLANANRLIYLTLFLIVDQALEILSVLICLLLFALAIPRSVWIANHELVPLSDRHAQHNPTDETVCILVRVTVPIENALGPNHPTRLFLSGNVQALGNWRPDGLQLKRELDGSYTGEFRTEPGTGVEFKVTRGSWATVEQDTAGNEIANRHFLVTPLGDETHHQIDVKVERWATPQQPASSVTGTLILHQDFDSQYVKHPRTIGVWLPPGYRDSTRRFPVLYLQDGQNLFDNATAAFGVEWQVDESATRLIEQEKISPLIVVGVWNTSERISEYTLSRDNRTQRGGQGRAYIKFLSDELKPFIDRTYRTQSQPQQTLVGGSSLGGLISIHACIQRPDTFGGCMALSPSLHWDQDRLLLSLAADHQWPPQNRIWFSMGTHEGSSNESREASLNRAQRLAKLLQDHGRQPKRDYWFYQVNQGRHNETAWAAQFPDALTFLANKSE